VKRFLLPYAAVAWATLLFAGPAAGALIISEYVEGSSNNKAIELYNTGPEAIGLTGVFLRVYANGSSTPTSSVALNATLPAGAAWVIAHSSASFATEADQTSGVLSFNGDDAVVLESAGAVLDRIGQVGFDPGTGWGSALGSTLDTTLRRMPSVLTGHTAAGTPFDPSLQWLGFARDSFDGLGVHQVLSIPEPQSWMVLACGLMGLAGVTRFTRGRSTG
jgi:predicted extracellular nuclease